jgi:hypothetical protein
LPNHFENFGPGRIQPLVNLLVHLDGHAELELLAGHFAFFGGFAIVGSTTAGASAALKAGGFAAVDSAAALWAGISGFFSGALPSIGAGAAINHALATIRALRLPIPTVTFIRRRIRKLLGHVHLTLFIERVRPILKCKIFPIACFRLPSR